MLYLIKNNMLVCLFTLLATFKVAESATRSAGSIRVSMQGSIIDAPCAISTDSRFQIVDFSAFPISQLIDNGKTEKKQFSIKLVNCDLVPTQANRADRPWQNFSMTFDADHLDSQKIKLGGETRGVAIQIEDTNGKILAVGEPVVIDKLDSSGLQLDYLLSLVIFPGESLNLGKFSTAIRFTFNYY